MRTSTYSAQRLGRWKLEHSSATGMSQTSRRFEAAASQHSQNSDIATPYAPLRDRRLEHDVIGDFSAQPGKLVDISELF
jgi:hypothetical protein